MTRLVLASESPRRRLLLSTAGFHFDVVAPRVDETPLRDETPRDMVERLASLKARSVVVGAPAIVLAADTAVVVDGEDLGKPADRAEAGEMLRRLAGRTHTVLTGWCAVHTDGRSVDGITQTLVSMRPLDEEAIDAYLDSGEWRDKAGAYGLQGLASGFVDHLDGPRSNVIGLPIRHVVAALGQLGLERSGA